MLDNLLFKNIIAVLRAGLDQQGQTDIKILQSYQPRQQGVESGKVLYVHKIADHRYGFLRRADTTGEYEELIHTETQIYESMFQISALSIQDPAVVDQMTAADICNLAAAIMQSDTTVNTLFENNIGIYRVTDIRNPYFVDDFDRFEASPSFDFTLQHEQVIISTTPAVESFEFNIETV